MAMKRSRQSFWLSGAAAVLLGIVVAAPAAVLACPSCKDAISNDAVADAFSWTTLLLIAMPMLLVGSIGGWVAYVYWRAARSAAAAGDASPQPSGNA